MVLYSCSKGTKRKNKNRCCREGGRKEGFIMAIEKFCTKCGKKFLAVGREVICPSCKQAAAEESKRAAVLRAKRASWNGESVPVRISGRASTVIRAYGAANNVPFAAALDAILKASGFRQSVGGTWEDITPYKSHRRDRQGKQDAPQDGTQTAQDGKQDATSKPQEVKQAAKVANKNTTSKTAKTVKTAGKKVKA